MGSTFDYEKLVVGEKIDYTKDEYPIKPDDFRSLVSRLFLEFPDTTEPILSYILFGLSWQTHRRYRLLIQSGAEFFMLTAREIETIRNIRRLIKMALQGTPIDIELDRTAIKQWYGDLQKFKPTPDPDDIFRLIGMTYGRLNHLMQAADSISITDALSLWELPGQFEAQGREYFGGIDIPYSRLKFDRDELQRLVNELQKRFGLKIKEIALRAGVSRGFFSVKKRISGKTISAYVIIRLYHLLKECESEENKDRNQQL